MPSCDYCTLGATTAWLPDPGPLDPYDPGAIVDVKSTIRPIWACLAHADRARQDRDACQVKRLTDDATPPRR